MYVLTERDNLAARLREDVYERGGFWWLLESVELVWEGVDRARGVIEGVFVGGLEEVIYCPQCRFSGAERLRAAERECERVGGWLVESERVEEGFVLILGLGRGERVGVEGELWRELEAAVRRMTRG